MRRKEARGRRRKKKEMRNIMIMTFKIKDRNFPFDLDGGGGEPPREESGGGGGMAEFLFLD